MTKQAKVYRQGDVWIYSITRTEFVQARAGQARKVEPDPDIGVILAAGEVTGHHHRIPEAERVALRLSRENGLVRFLEVTRPASLVHEEHETIKLPPGYYEVRIQREYNPTVRARQTYVTD